MKKLGKSRLVFYSTGATSHNLEAYVETIQVKWMPVPRAFTDEWLEVALAMLELHKFTTNHGTFSINWRAQIISQTLENVQVWRARLADSIGCSLPLPEVDLRWESMLISVSPAEWGLVGGLGDGYQQPALLVSGKLTDSSAWVHFVFVQWIDTGWRPLASSRDGYGHMAVLVEAIGPDGRTRHSNGELIQHVLRIEESM